ncbi:hypothetical protein GINT2_002249 [Glugoides intestinalis]
MSKRRAVRYLHLEAESDSEEYKSEEFSEDLDDIKPLEVSKVKSFDEFAEELKERYGEERYEEEEVLEAPLQGHLLPTAQSPLLFIVRCKVGKEKEICQRIFERSEDSGICSVVQKEGLKGYIYIESFKKQEVEEALAKVRNVARRRFNVVPLKEMVEAMSYRKEIVVSEFARIKGGKYRGDLVQILENFEDVVKVKAVPRINSVKRRFDASEHQEEIEYKDGGCYYNRDFYKDGYLEKIMLKSNLDFEVEPTFGELEELNLQGNIAVNERVRVSKGELRNIVGTVESIKGNVAQIRAEGKSYEAILEDVEKFYEVGQEVSYRGENGVILAIEGQKAVLGMDDFTREMICSFKDLKSAVSEKRIEKEKQYRFKVFRDPLTNQQVRITGGEYKGLQGTVKDAFQDKCIIHLRSSRRNVTIDRELVVQLGNGEMIEEEENITETIGGRTPAFRTPGAKTPSHKTPSYRTPSYRTPSIEMKDRNSANTALAEEAGTEWLTSANDEVEIISSGKVHVVSEIENGVFKAKTGEMFLSHEIGYSLPEKYDRVVIMEGDSKGIEGTLVSLSNGDKRGVVRSQDGELYDIDIDKITKKAN